MILRNSSLQALTFASSMLSAFVVYALIGRTYQAAVLGAVIFWGTVWRIGLAVADIGVSTYLKREFASHRDEARDRFNLSGATGLRLAALVLPGAILPCFMGAGVFPGYYLIGLSVYFVLWTKFVAEIGYSIAMGRGDFAGPAALVFVLETLFVILSAALIFLGSRVESIFLAGSLLFGCGIIAVATYVRTHHAVRMLVLPTFSATVGAAKNTIALGIGTVVTLLAFKSDTVLIGLLTDAASVGLYGASYTIANSARLVGASIASAALPQLSGMHGHGDPILPKLSRLLVLVGALGLCLSALAWLFGDTLLVWIYGSAFGEGHLALTILALAIPIAFANMLLWVAFVALQSERVAVRLLLTLSAMNVGLNIGLILWLGYVGAAYASLISELLMLAGYLVLIRMVMPGRARTAPSQNRA